MNKREEARDWCSDQGTITSESDTHLTCEIPEGKLDFEFLPSSVTDDVFLDSVDARLQDGGASLEFEHAEAEVDANWFEGDKFQTGDTGSTMYETSSLVIAVDQLDSPEDFYHTW